MVQLYSKSRQSCPTTSSFLFCHLLSVQHLLESSKALILVLDNLGAEKFSLKYNLVPELHELDQKSLGESNDCFFTKRNITFLIYRSTEVLQI